MSDQIIWASSAPAASKTAPSAEKQAQGWQDKEIPPHEHFNWWQNRTDTRLNAMEDAVGGVSMPEPATATPKAPGTAAVGTSTKYAREDHVHASQSVPSAATATPKAPGTAAVGTSTKFAREDHVHPAQTTVSNAGVVNLLGNRSTTGDWSLTVVKGKPVYIINTLLTGDTNYSVYVVKSGGVGGVGIVGSYDGVSDLCGNVWVGIPTATTMVISVGSSYGFAVKAYQ